MLIPYCLNSHDSIEKSNLLIFHWFYFIDFHHAFRSVEWEILKNAIRSWQGRRKSNLKHSTLNHSTVLRNSQHEKPTIANNFDSFLQICLKWRRVSTITQYNLLKDLACGASSALSCVVITYLYDAFDCIFLSFRRIH